MAGLTLDAGALIAADRNERRFWRFWKLAMRREHRLDCVIWSELPPNFEHHTGRPFSAAAAVSYLGELPKVLVDQAREYVDRAPACVDTPLWRRLADEGWLSFRPGSGLGR